MTEVLYCDIDIITDPEACLHLMPPNMWPDITRYRFLEDRKMRLAARLMLLHCLERAGDAHLLQTWKRDEHNKPKIDHGPAFNIAHSGNLVVLAYGGKEPGIDIEKKVSLKENDAGLPDFFHPEEREYLLRSENYNDSFYDIWVKKEALLKAAGTGIVQGMQQVSCITDHVHYLNADRYLHQLTIHTDYTCYLCTTDETEYIMPAAFMPGQ